MCAEIHRIRVYVDNSVFGGNEDDEFRTASRAFFRQVRNGTYIALVSAATLEELAGAPEDVQEVYESLPDHCVEQVDYSEEARSLAESYLEAGVLGRASETDALHVALATVAGADLLLSWNFKHIVNYNRIRGFNSVNVRLGFRSMAILSPLETGDDDTTEEV